MKEWIIETRPVTLLWKTSVRQLSSHRTGTDRGKETKIYRTVDVNVKEIVQDIELRPPTPVYQAVTRTFSFTELIS